jgi:FMN phosphatase YigB (HAD superfamily)
MPIRAVLFDLGDTLWHFPHFPDDAAVVRELTERVARACRVRSRRRRGLERLALAVRAAMGRRRGADHARSQPGFLALVRAAAEHGLR